MEPPVKSQQRGRRYDGLGRMIVVCVVVEDVVIVTVNEGQPELDLGPRVEAAVNSGIVIVDRPAWYVQYR